MGKIFPTVTTLKQKPSCLDSTLKLIEESFQYSSPHSFQVDFAPLMNKENHHNCFILIDENENVLAHVGVKERIVKIGGKEFSICMLGGIAVGEEHRGQGYFQHLFHDVMAEKRSDCSFFLLWSDQEKLYAKYGFYLCGSQWELPSSKSESKFKITTYAQLSSAEREQVQALYRNSFQSCYQTVERSEEDWQMIAEISSSKLFLRKSESKITSYFFLGKGQDLEGIVHEYGTTESLQDLLTSAQSEGNVWIGHPFKETDQLHFQFMLSPADLKHFAEFISAYTEERLKIRDVNVMKAQVFFDFNGETLMLETEEFLRGIFGPGSFEELGELKPFFISGLDSI